MPDHNITYPSNQSINRIGPVEREEEKNKKNNDDNNIPTDKQRLLALPAFQIAKLRIAIAIDQSVRRQLESSFSGPEGITVTIAIV